MAQLIGFEPMHRYNRPSGLANHPLYHLSTVAYMVREPRLELRIRESKSHALPLGYTPIRVRWLTLFHQPRQRYQSWGIRQQTHAQRKDSGGTPNGTRTHDLRFRRPLLYPTELLGHIGTPSENRTHDTSVKGRGLNHLSMGVNGTPYGTRTHDSHIKSVILYRLS